MIPALVHACASASLGYALRAATFSRSWIDVPLLDADPGGVLPRLSIVVPARDEERSIEACVRSLLAQEGLDSEVIVVDDRSSDGTRAILARLAEHNRRLRIVDGAPLPDGWIGKPWALQQGAEIANGAWLLFTDADSVHARHGARSALWLAIRSGSDALSIATRQEFGTFWERAVLPSILGLIVFAAGPFADINDAQKPQAIANGQYILVSRVAYDALGGHAALRKEIVEDVAFARRLKADGRFRLLFAGGHRIASVRMYRSLREIWLGFTKNAYVGGDGNVVKLMAGVLFMSAISCAPAALAAYALARRRYVPALEAIACLAANVATTSWSMRRAAFPRRLALWQPVGTTIFAAIILNSTVRVLTGQGVVWRGRSYSGRR